MHLRGIFVCAACLPALVGCYEAPEFEDAPPSTVRWDTYEQPTLLIETSNVDQVAEAVAAEIEAYADACGWGPSLEIDCSGSSDVCDACGLLRELRTRLEIIADEVDVSSDGVTVEEGGQPSQLGIIRLRSRCDEGRLDARVRFGKDGLGPAIWGAFDACRFSEPLSSLVLRGSFRVDFGRSFTNPLEVGDWVRFEAEALALDDGEIFNLRWRPTTGEVQLRFSVDGEEGLLIIGPRFIRIEDATTSWVCDFEERQCVSERDDRIDLAD